MVTVLPCFYERCFILTHTKLWHSELLPVHVKKIHNKRILIFNRAEPSLWRGCNLVILNVIDGL